MPISVSLGIGKSSNVSHNYICLHSFSRLWGQHIFTFFYIFTSKLLLDIRAYYFCNRKEKTEGYWKKSWKPGVCLKYLFRAPVKGPEFSDPLKSLNCDFFWICAFKMSGDMSTMLLEKNFMTFLSSTFCLALKNIPHHIHVCSQN